jgi:hypothetical protein
VTIVELTRAAVAVVFHTSEIGDVIIGGVLMPPLASVVLPEADVAVALSAKTDELA